MKIGYARVSTTDQSLDLQIEQLEKAGCEKIYAEKKSGVDDKRPELAACLDFVREGDTVVVCKLDRLARSTKHLLGVVEDLTGRGIGFKVLNIDLDTSTPTGKLMLTMLGAVAAFERELLRERQREGIVKAKAAGKFKGRKPTARAKGPDILKMIEDNPKTTRVEIARLTGISEASLYRILKEAK